MRSSCSGSGERKPFTMPMTMGKKQRYMEMIDFGSRPVKPKLPSTTMIIGAMARIGMVCEAMIQGIRLLSQGAQMDDADRQQNAQQRAEREADHRR